MSKKGGGNPRADALNQNSKAFNPATQSNTSRGQSMDPTHKAYNQGGGNRGGNGGKKR